MDIFEAIRESHQTQRTLLDLLVKTSGDSEGRDELFGRLKAELEHHALAEERHFYAPLMEVDETQELARHSVAEHEEIDDLIERLEDTEYRSSGWLTIAKSLKETVEHHLDEEEAEVFPVAGRALTATQKVELAEGYQAQMEELAEG